MITLTLTEAEAAHICYALEAEAGEYNRKAWDERKNGAFNVASGNTQMLLERSRDSRLAIVRRIDALLEV